MKKSLDRTIATRQVERLVELHRSGRITRNAFLGALADLITSENFDEVVSAIPDDYLGMVREWSRSLPEPEKETLWPLPMSVRLSFKKWLEQNP